MLTRELESELERSLGRFPVVALTGPRQVGKTTLARHIATQHAEALFLDLELPSDLARLTEPELYLSARQNRLVIIDEVQRAPELFPVLRALVDAHRVPGRFLLLGSASPELINRSAESLAGRIRYLELPTLSIQEAGANTESVRQLWLRGGFPESFLAADNSSAFEWQEAFVRTYLERDIPNLGFRIPAQALRRFWQMLAHWHGQLWYASALAQSLGTSAQTMNRYLDLLCDAYIARRLQPLSGNFGKRLVKSPKVYLRDSGILHYLLNIGDADNLEGNPALGASWEGFIVEKTLTSLAPREAHFYRTAAGAELDLVVELDGSPQRYGIEIKYSAAPKPTKGFWHALEDLQIQRAVVIYPGREIYPLDHRTLAWPAHRIPELRQMLVTADTLAWQ